MEAHAEYAEKNILDLTTSPLSAEFLGGLRDLKSCQASNRKPSAKISRC